MYAGPRSDLCNWVGRTGACVHSASDFQGCEVGTDDPVCVAICEDLFAAIAVDAQTVHETEVRSSECICNACRSVVRVGDKCFADGNRYERFDCSMTDEAILAAADASGSCGP